MNNNSPYTIDHAKLLYKILPSVYRERDENDDLKKYLNGTGALLDQIHQTLIQRYADIFPDTDQSFAIDSQSWLLPYIGALFNAKRVAPDTAGQREEIANTISWRKGKGTLKVIEQITESIGQMEAVVHEGWKRVATTATIGKTILPAKAYGYTKTKNYTEAFDRYQKTRSPDWAPLWARHPGLKAGTVDLRCQGSAVKAEINNPAASTSTIAGKSYHWRQSSLHGSQSCNKGRSILPMKNHDPDWIPGYFDDPSVRSVDFRNPTWRQGHYHPRRVLIFTATHNGFFNFSSGSFSWNNGFLEKNKMTDKNLSDKILSLISISREKDKITIRNNSLDSKTFKPITIHTPDELQQNSDGYPSVWRFEGFYFDKTLKVKSGGIELDRCAALKIKTLSANTQEPQLKASNCLFKNIQIEKGLCELQYCTILKTTIAAKLNASDCVFNGLIGQSLTQRTLPDTGCVRYSSILPKQKLGEIQYFHHHQLKAVFYQSEFKQHQKGCGVLHPATAIEISNGAADGGEMGAFHHMHLVARQQAILSKLIDFMPTGMQAVIIPDSSLNQLPGEIEQN